MSRDFGMIQWFGMISIIFPDTNSAMIFGLSAVMIVIFVEFLKKWREKRPTDYDILQII